jgi:cold shock CspA family protein
VERGTGTVSFYDPQRNFGFIEPDDGGADVIFYLRDGDQQVDIGDTVSFDVLQPMSVTEIGRQAIRVTRLGFPAASTTPAVVTQS